MIAMVFSPLSYFNGNIFIPVCPKEVISLSGSGKISSPNYPMSNYTMSTNCTWKITGSASQKIKFAFTDFALSPCAADCNSDSCSYVELYDGGSTSSPFLARFCDGSILNETFSEGHEMFVRFHSGKTVDRGFEAEYHVSYDGQKGKKLAHYE